MPTLKDLQYFQAMPLRMKMDLSRNRIREWINHYGEDGCYISFSGGKDSTVLLDLVRNYCGYKKVPAMFVDVPTQYPELREFVETFDNVDIVKPKISFAQVCEKYGFPLISKEVSECVSGARKYLNSLLTEIGGVNTTTSMINFVEQAHMNAIGGGTDTSINVKPQNCLELTDCMSIQNPTRGGVR